LAETYFQFGVFVAIALFVIQFIIRRSAMENGEKIANVLFRISWILGLILLLISFRLYPGSGDDYGCDPFWANGRYGC
jgi:hypothetical protein